MGDATTPQGAVEQGVPSEESLTSILDGAFGEDMPTPKAKQQQPEQPEQEAAADQDSDEPTPDDLPDDDAAPQSAPVGDEFEIVHDGKQHKLSREETIKLAQQGFDYTQKTQRLAENHRQAEAVFQKAAELEQITPLVIQEIATVRAIETQLQQWQNVDWVRLATDDPLEYPRYRAQYDAAVNGYQQAREQLNHKLGAVSQARQQFTAEQLRQEAQRLTEIVPEWRDSSRYQSEAKELGNYLLKEGYAPEEVNGANRALYLKTARKAMLYDKLVATKAERSKQVRAAPPVVRPGANAPTDAGRQNFAKIRTEIVKAGRQGKSASQEQMMIGLLNKTFKK